MANPCHLCWAVGWFVSWPFKLFHTYLQVVKNRVLLRPPFSSHKLHQTDLHTAAKTARDWFESLFGFFLFWQGVGPAGVPCFFFWGVLALHINDSFRVQLTDFKIPGQPAWRISTSFFFSVPWLFRISVPVHDVFYQ